MKKIILSAIAFAVIAIPTFSQEKVMKQNSLWDNWFIQAQGGASYTFSESNRDASISDLITPAVALSVGKHFSPVLGVRAQVSGWESKSQYGWADDTYRHKYVQGTVDGMLNVTNLFSRFNGDRAFNLYGLLGISAIHGMHKNGINVDGEGNSLGKSNMIMPRVGFQADYLVANNVSVNLEVTGNLLEDRFNGRSEGKAYDGMLTAMAGVTYHFNKKGFEVLDYVDISEIDALNKKINDQKSALNGRDSKISELQAALAKKPEVVVQKETIEQEETEMNAVVVFKLGKSDLQDNQEINIYNAAKYFQENPDMDVIVTGYADNATGNATINQKLSERRAEAVAKILIEKFNIPSSRITTKGGGDKVQPFQIDAWNRVVIFTAIKKK